MPSNNMNWNPSIPQNSPPSYSTRDEMMSPPSPPPSPPPPRSRNIGLSGLPLNGHSNGELSTPPQESFNNEAMRGSMQQILSENLGEFVVCEFIIGTQGLVQKEGILYSVGRNYIALYDDLYNRYVVCDIFSIKFVTFYYPGERPPERERASRNTPVR